MYKGVWDLHSLFFIEPLRLQQFDLALSASHALQILFSHLIPSVFPRRSSVGMTSDCSDCWCICCGFQECSESDSWFLRTLFFHWFEVWARGLILISWLACIGGQEGLERSQFQTCWWLEFLETSQDIGVWKDEPYTLTCSLMVGLAFKRGSNVLHSALGAIWPKNVNVQNMDASIPKWENINNGNFRAKCVDTKHENILTKNVWLLNVSLGNLPKQGW